MKKLLLVGLFALVACGNPSQTVNNDVDAAVVALTAAETLALHYTSLPRCPTSTVVCSDEAVVAKIKSLDNAAYSAVKMAQADKTQVAAALTAIGALKAAIPAAQ